MKRYRNELYEEEAEQNQIDQIAAGQGVVAVAEIEEEEEEIIEFKIEEEEIMEEETIEEKKVEEEETVEEKKIVRYDLETVPRIPDFQIAFSSELYTFLKDKSKKDPIYKKTEIIIDNFKVSGEAEHKCMQYLRYISNQPDWNPLSNVWIYSYDNDVILLSLGSYIHNISIVLSTESSKAKILNCNVLRQYIAAEYQIKDQNLANIIDDIICIQFFLCNDYLPHISGIPRTFQYVLQLHKKIYEKDNNLHAYLKSMEPNSNFFIALLNELETDVNKEIEQKEWETYTSFYPDETKEMSISYFKTIAWILYLNKTGCPSPTHYYKYSVAPPFSQLKSFIILYVSHEE